VRWWAPPITLEEAREAYMPRIEGSDPMFAFIVVVDGREVGYIQWYRVSDDPDAMDIFSLDEEAAQATAGVDFSLGEIDLLGRGVGRLILRRFVEDVVLRAPGIERVVIDPDPGNERAVRCYRAAGFEDRGVVVDGKTGERWLVMEYGRGEGPPTAPPSLLHEADC
jgi:RimJ/RimL family protein N-acetyltransferase